MADHTPVKPTPKQVKESEALWDSFVQYSKYAIIFTCVTLVGLAAAFVPW